MKRKVFLLAAMPLIVAAAPTWQQRTLASAAPFIDKANDDWTRAIVSGNADALSAPYAKDGIFVGPDATAIHSKAGVRTMYSRRPKGTKVLRATIHSDGRVAADPDDVYEWGTATATLKTPTGTTKKSLGRFLTVWHRQGTTWVITRNIAF